MLYLCTFAVLSLNVIIPLVVLHWQSVQLIDRLYMSNSLLLNIMSMINLIMSIVISGIKFGKFILSRLSRLRPIKLCRV